MRLSFSREYFAHLDTAHSGIAGASALVVDDNFSRRYRSWLRVAFDVIRATTPLLNFCLARLDRLPDSEFNHTFRAYVLDRIENEAGHDTLFLEDLKRAGVSAEALYEELPQPAIAAMVGSQYYYIDHFHPAVHLGYIGLLEGYPPTLADADTLAEFAGAGSEAWSTYRLHAELDEEHGKSLATILDAVPDWTWLRKAIVSNGIRCAEHYCEALETISLLHGKSES